MTGELVCACGRRLRVGEHHAGRRIQCPGCGAGLVVPETTNTTAPTPLVGIKPPSRLPTLILLALLLPGLIGLAVIVWRNLTRDQPKPSEDVSELRLIPHDARGFVRLRLSELWKNDAARVAYEKVRLGNPDVPDPLDRLERITGLQPEQVERLCLVLMGANPRSNWTVVASHEPYDAVRILTRIRQGREVRYEQRSYYVGTDPEGRELAVCFLTPTLFLAGPEDGVKLCLTRLAMPPLPTPFSPLGVAIGRYLSGEHVVGGMDPAALPDEMRILPAIEEFTKARTATVTIHVEEAATVHGEIQTLTDEQAKKLAESLTTVVGTMRLQLWPMQLMGGDKGKAAGLLLKFIKGLKFEVKEEKKIHATFKTDLETPADLLFKLQSQMGQ